jgi:DNA-binding response OmpR family regulator
MRREQRTLPVLMLTARSEVADRIRGLDAGADDYLVKPFDFGELLARLRALGRRSQSERAPLAEVGELRLDAATRTVTRAGLQVELTAREFEVLALARRRHVVSRRCSIRSGTATTMAAERRRRYVGYLRRKLEAGPAAIRTIARRLHAGVG